MTNLYHRKLILSFVAEILPITMMHFSAEQLRKKFTRCTKREEKLFYRILSMPLDVEEKLSGTYVL